MSTPENPWLNQYEKLTAVEEIRARAAVAGRKVLGLEKNLAEDACRRLQQGLGAVFIATTRNCEIMGGEIERAYSFARENYHDPTLMLQRVYEGGAEEGLSYPTCITGPAGTGKSALTRALGRIFAKDIKAQPDANHCEFPLSAYTRIVIGGNTSVSRNLRILASPDIAEGRCRVVEADLPRECSAWLDKTGKCLFGVDEMQFLTQSERASSLLSKVLLSYALIGRPWHFVANYSLCWRLLKRAPEVTQRLLASPKVLLPDPPDSEDWISLLTEYQRVAGTYFSFTFVEQSVVLWNLSAGLKRELIKLLVHAYRLCRERGASIVTWTDLTTAYGSGFFSAARNDIERIIQNAAQGGKLPNNLCNPFTGGAISVDVEKYRDALKDARAKIVAAAAMDASMTVAEKAGSKAFREILEGNAASGSATVTKLPRKKLTLEGVLEAGRKFKESSGAKNRPTDKSN